MTDWQKLENKYYMQTTVRIPVTLVRGEGVRVWDDTGKEYLDCVGGLAVDCLGHCPQVIVDAICEQARLLMQTSLWYYTVPQVKLAQLLADNSCMDRVFICNSGLEANEGAIKLARRYAEINLKGAYEVITTNGSFHGRSLSLTAASGQPKMHEHFQPLPPGFVNVANNDIEAIKKATTDKTCAVLLEPVQAEGGVNVAADDYLKQVREWCDSRGILLILDEVQTGIGRLGTLFGYQLYGVEPDIMTLAKGLGGGIPIGAFLCKEKFSVFTPGDHNSTFGGNPVTSAAAYAALKYVLDNGIVARGRQAGERLMAGLKAIKAKYAAVTEVRGRGLLLAMEFDRDIAQDVLMACLEEGLLVNKLKPNAIRLIPPLVIGDDEIDTALGIIDEVLSGIVG
jgi:predicted acetylornithine/succinylornithine family transaminase